MSNLDLYNVQFIVKNIHGGIKSIKTINPSLSGYILSRRSIYRVNLLLDHLSEIVNGQKPSTEGFTQKNYYIITTQLQVKIYADGDAWFDNPNIQPDFVLPTMDFKVIIEAWRIGRSSNSKHP